MPFDVSPLKHLAQAATGGAPLPLLAWQAAVAGVAMLLGYSVARLACRQIRPDPRWKFGEGDFERVAYPLFAYLFLVLGRVTLERYQSVALLQVLQTLIVAWIVIRIAVYILGHVLPPGGFLRGAIRSIAWIAWIAVALHLTGLLPGVIEALDDVGLTVGKDKERVTLWLALQAVAALALTLTLAAWISRITQNRVLAAQNVEMSTRIVITKAVNAATLFLAILVALPMVGIPITALSVFSGALGVGLGFGLQKIASNYVSGFIVLLDKSLRIGDVISVDNRKGVVKAIESRYTVVRGGDGVESIIPNEKLITESVSHHTYSDPRVAQQLQVVTPFDVDVDQVCQLLLGAAKKHPHVLQEPAAVARVRNLRDHGIEFDLTVWMDMGAANDADLRSELFKDILQGFRQARIQIPYPRQDVHLIATPETVNMISSSKT